MSDWQRIIVDQIADGDQDIVQLFQFINTKFRGVNINDYLQLNKSEKRTYFVENQKVITQVYLEKQKKEVALSLQTMVERLLQY